jgi:tRNA(Ile)-lysidine synthase
VAGTNRLNPDLLATAALEHLPNGPLAVALGGGADSAVAAFVAAGRSGTRGVFIQHRLSGSADLERAARALGAELGIVVTVVEAPVDPGPSLEDRARRARWMAIDREVGEDETVVTGHTRDDQAETVLMNLLRGSGNAGIAGMRRSRPGIVRPLLDFSRSDLRAVATALDLPFVDDPANDDPAHLRNRVRSDLLPALECDYRPGIRKILARVGSLAAADDAVIEDLAADVPLIDDAGVVLIPSAPLVTLPHPVAARVVRRALRRLLTPYAGTTADVDAVLAVAEERSDTVTLTDALIVTREGPFTVIDRGSRVTPTPVRITVPSQIQFGGVKIAFEPFDRRFVTRRSTVLVDPSVFRGDATVRSSTLGDRIDIEAGSKAVRTVLAENDVAARLRHTWPVVAVSGRIAAVVGFRVAPWARPTLDRAVAVTRERGHS